MAELVTNFLIAMVTGILMVFAVLVLLFARVLQPITILGSLLLSFGGAVAVIGGLITSTALTLVIVPAAFTLVDDIERWLAPRFGRVLTAQPPPPATPPQPHAVN
jgi:multidrug efflux pump subunit AcrB